MPISYDVAVDWARNGDYTSTGDDVTNRILSDTPVTVRYGRDQARALSPATPGETSFSLYNESHDYTPGSASSPLFPNVLPRRPVRIRTIFNANPYFETNATNWTGNNGTFVRSTAQAHQGVASGLLTPTGGISQSYAESEQVPITGGGVLTASAWLRSGPGYANVSLSVNWFDSAHVYLSTSSSISSLAAATWTLREHVYTAPTTAAYASLVPTESGTPPATATLHVDEATLGVTLHLGKFADYDPQRDVYSSVDVTTLDGSADLGRTKLSTPLYQGLRTGAAIGFVLDAAGWPGGARDLDEGATVIPWWWEEGTAADEALSKLVDSEGPPAMLYVDPDTGNMVFRDRTHRLIDTPSKTSQATFRDSGTDSAAAVRFSLPLGYTQGWKDVINSVSFSVEERRPEGALTRVWETDEIISLAASEVRTVVMQTSDPFQGAVTPVAAVDYVILAGSLTSVTVSRTSGAASSVTLTASGSGCTIEGLALRAYSVSVARTWQINRTDTASITAYDLANHPGECPWAGRYDADSIAQVILIHRAQPLQQVQVRLRNGNDLISAQQMTRALSDRVTVTDAGTSVNADFYVERIEHAIRGQKTVPIVETVLGCEQVPAGLPASTFILNTSLLNGASTLAY